MCICVADIYNIIVFEVLHFENLWTLVKIFMVQLSWAKIFFLNLAELKYGSALTFCG